MPRWQLEDVLNLLSGEILQLALELVFAMVVLVGHSIVGALRQERVHRRKFREQRREVPASDLTWLTFVQPLARMVQLAGMPTGTWPPRSGHGALWHALLTRRARERGWATA